MKQTILMYAIIISILLSSTMLITPVVVIGQGQGQEQEGEQNQKTKASEANAGGNTVLHIMKDPIFVNETQVLEVKGAAKNALITGRISFENMGGFVHLFSGMTDNKGKFMFNWRVDKDTVPGLYLVLVEIKKNAQDLTPKLGLLSYSAVDQKGAQQMMMQSAERSSAEQQQQQQQNQNRTQEAIASNTAPAPSSIAEPLVIREDPYGVKSSSAFDKEQAEREGKMLADPGLGKADKKALEEAMSK